MTRWRIVQRAGIAAAYRLPTKPRRRLLFVMHNHRIPHFRNPVTFNDKVNWRILNDRRQLLEFTCDKLAMKDHVRAIPGLVVPRTLWSGTDVRQLAQVELPDQWVLKPNHRSGVVYFGKGRPDIDALAEVTKYWRQPTESDGLREWAYGKARPLLIAEELLGVPGSPPPDYKFFVFAGHVAAVQVDTDRHTAHKRRIYLPDWTPLDVTSGNYPLAPVEPPPGNLAQMLTIASEIGRQFDFIRVDLYSIDDSAVFGEITPYAGSGLDKFVPASFDEELGMNWELPRIS